MEICSKVLIVIFDCSVLCTGHLSAISMSLPLLIAERALQCNGAIDVIEHADFGVAAFAIVDMDSAVT